MGRKSKKQKWKENIGYAVTKLNAENVKKLGEAFALGLIIEEACSYADISPQTYYNWTKKNPELLEYFDRMRRDLPLKAKKNIADKIANGDVRLSQWLVERQQPEDYGETLKLEHSGEIGDGTPDEDKAAIAAMHATLKENLKKRSREKAKAEGEL